MRKVEIVPVTDEHIAAMLPNIRQADRDEFAAAAGMLPAGVIARAMKSASVSAAGLTSGNALDLTAETVQFGQLDALTTINNAQRQAAGLQFQADNSRAQAKIEKQSGMLGAGATLLNSTLTGLSAYKTLGGTALNDAFATTAKKTAGGYGTAWNNYLKGSL